MKIVITSTGNATTAQFDQRFGRAGWFCVFNPENGEINFIENENLNAMGGAGTKTAEKMAELGVTKVISGHFGPKAKELLDKLKIQMIMLEDENITIREILEKFQLKH